MIEFYRDWAIWLSQTQPPSAIIRPPGGGEVVRIERASEKKLFAAVVDYIDQALIDKHVPTVERSLPSEFETIEMSGAEL